MRFMVLMFPGDKDMESGKMPDDKAVATMMKFNEDLAKAGVLLACDGLYPTSKGARIALRGGERKITDGPFAEAREVVGGYWMWEVKSKEEALAWASRCPIGDGDTLELREVFDSADFSPEVAKQEAVIIAAAEKSKAAKK